MAGFQAEAQSLAKIHLIAGVALRVQIVSDPYQEGDGSDYVLDINGVRCPRHEPVLRGHDA